MAPKPEPPLRAVEDKKAVGRRHKQPGRLAFVSWATIRRIYDIVHAALWALAVATVVNMIINIPQISEARRRAELQRVQEISEENRFYCTKWGLRANTHEHLICMMDLDAIRAKVEERISEDWIFRTTQRGLCNDPPLDQLHVGSVRPERPCIFWTTIWLRRSRQRKVYKASQELPRNENIGGNNCPTLCVEYRPSS